MTRTANRTTQDTSPVTAARRRFFAPALLLGLFASLATAGVAAADWTYRVRPGDTVWDLAGKYVRGDIPWQRLQSYNRVADPYHLPPGSLMRFPVAWLKQQPAKARVVGVHGGAFAINARGNRTPVSEGMRLGIGTTLQTATDGNLTLQFADGSRLLLEADSELKLDKLGAYGATGMVDTRMRLPKGRASSEVKSLRGSESHYIIQTPDIMSSVRGTSFRVGSGNGRSQVEVIEGHVQVAGASHEVVLKPNQGTISGAAGTPGAAQALLAEPASLQLDETRAPPAVVRWDSVPGARSYRVQVGTTPAFLSLLHDRVVAGTQDSLDGLPQGTLGIRVRAIDAQGLEGRDATIEARIASRPPFAIEPAEGATVDVDRPRFRWASLGPDVRYRFQLAGSAGFDRPIVDLDKLDAVDLRSPQALPPGNYAWRVASIDGTGHSSFNDGVHFAVVPPGTGPEISGDTHDAAGELQVRWPAGTPGQRFRFQLARDASFSRLEVDRMIDGNQAALPGLGAGTWHARVQVVDSDGYAHPFGSGQSFKVGCLPCRWAAGGGLLILLLSL
ncbi:MAG: FecR domain-containing protein [Thermomonas sp.]